MSHEALGRTYVTGLDRTAARLKLTVDGDLMTCQRDANESGRYYVPWSIPGYGTAFVNTATLIERPEPYILAVELARGKLNDVRNQLADWRQMGLRTDNTLDARLADAQAAFFQAVTARDDLDLACKAAERSIEASWQTGQHLVELYVQQVIHTRLTGGTKLPTQLGLAIESEPKKPWSEDYKLTFNSARLACSWKTVCPTESHNNWDVFDAQLAWAAKQKVMVQGGPLIDLRPGAMPDWLSIWDGDFESVLGHAIEHVRQVLTRYKGKVGTWTLIHRPASTDILRLGEEDQIRMAARLLQVARTVDPSAQYLVGLDRPWGEWLGGSSFQLGPLHLADYLARSDLGLSGLSLEIALGYSAPGSGLRDLFDFSRLLDLYALINLPLFINISLPSSHKADANADKSIKLEPRDWPVELDESVQAHWAAGFIALAVAKPFVKAVNWNDASDGSPHLYPNAGLYHKDQSPKSLVAWLKNFRRDLLT
jgi:hypothetical protein